MPDTIAHGAGEILNRQRIRNDDIIHDPVAENGIEIISLAAVAVDRKSIDAVIVSASKAAGVRIGEDDIGRLKKDRAVRRPDETAPTRSPQSFMITAADLAAMAVRRVIFHDIPTNLRVGADHSVAGRGEGAITGRLEIGRTETEPHSSPCSG